MRDSGMGVLKGGQQQADNSCLVHTLHLFPFRPAFHLLSPFLFFLFSFSFPLSIPPSFRKIFIEHLF